MLDSTFKIFIIKPVIMKKTKFDIEDTAITLENLDKINFLGCIPVTETTDLFKIRRDVYDAQKRAHTHTVFDLYHKGERFWSLLRENVGGELKSSCEHLLAFLETDVENPENKVIFIMTVWTLTDGDIVLKPLYTTEEGKYHLYEGGVFSVPCDHKEKEHTVLYRVRKTEDILKAQTEEERKNIEILHVVPFKDVKFVFGDEKNKILFPKEVLKGKEHQLEEYEKELRGAGFTIIEKSETSVYVKYYFTITGDD